MVNEKDIIEVGGVGLGWGGGMCKRTNKILEKKALVKWCVGISDSKLRLKNPKEPRTGIFDTFLASN